MKSKSKIQISDSLKHPYLHENKRAGGGSLRKANWLQALYPDYKKRITIPKIAHDWLRNYIQNWYMDFNIKCYLQLDREIRQYNKLPDETYFMEGSHDKNNFGVASAFVGGKFCFFYTEKNQLIRFPKYAGKLLSEINN